MFKNRAAQIKFVKTDKNDSTETPKNRRTLSADEIATIKSAAKAVGIFVVASVVILKSTDALCTIAINIAPKN